jgi:hypothetical protein
MDLLTHSNIAFNLSITNEWLRSNSIYGQMLNSVSNVFVKHTKNRKLKYKVNVDFFILLIY